MAKKDKPFNNPFGALKLKPEPRVPAARPPPPPTVPAHPEESERALFLSSVGAVEPLPVGRARVPAQKPLSVPAITTEDDEVLGHLSELVAGDAPFDLADSDEVIEGSIAQLGGRILERLRAGEFAVQGHLDLHGLTREEARAALERFLVQSRHNQHRCVLVIHGRGLHSKDQLPVLKEGIRLWLSRGRIGRQVLAFTSARPHDGGAGAVYVLLRR